jgi:CubicO group peptidase (beta-lactamase class C family)
MEQPASAAARLDRGQHELTFADDFSGDRLDPERWVDHYLPHWTTPERSAARYELGDGLRLLIEADQPAWRPEDGELRVSNIQTGSFSGPSGSPVGQHRHRDGLLVRTAQPARRLWTPSSGLVEVVVAASADPRCLTAVWLVGFEEGSPAESGEICVAELFGDAIGPGRSQVRLGVKAHHDPRLRTDMVDLLLDLDATEAHSYAAEWDGSGVRFFVDDHLVRTADQVIDYPLQLMVDLFELPVESVRDPAGYPKSAHVTAVRGYRPSRTPSSPKGVATPLPRSTPQEQQVDPTALLALLDALEGDPDIEMHSLMVVRHGHVVAEGWWAPYSSEHRQLLYSLSKSFTSTATAFAQAEGLLDLDDPLLKHFPELDAEIVEPRSRAITLRHLAAMASGHSWDTIDMAFDRDPEEPVRGFLLTPPDREPGSLFAYNQLCTYSLASVIQRNAGTPLTEYLRPRLLDPLGIAEVGWQSWPPGRELGFTGLHARTEDVAKLGLLHLQRGRWGDEQLLSKAWVAAATSKRIDNADQPNPDWRQGYGYQFWIARHGYRGDGAFGQLCVVLPEHDTVVVTTARTEKLQAILDALWTELLPGLGRTTQDVEVEKRLAQRLERLQLPAQPGDAAPPKWEPWVAGAFPVVRDGPGSSSALGSVEVRRAGDAVQLVLTEPDNELVVAVGLGSWTVSEPLDQHGRVVPVAASGGWEDAATLRVAVFFLETPHRLDVTLALADRTARAVWPHPPLGGDRLAELRCP